MVHRVLSFRPQLQSETFPQPECFESGHVKVVHTRVADTRETQRERTDIRDQLLGGVALEAGVDIEPLLHAALIARQRNVLDIASEDDVAPIEGSAAAGHVNTLYRPAAEDMVDHAGRAGQPAPPLAEGQFKRAVGGEAVRPVERRDDLLQVHVGRV